MTSKAGVLSIRTTLRPGDLGTIVQQHGIIYAAEYGLDSSFEPYVAKPLAEFCIANAQSAGPPSAGCLWIAQQGTEFAGSIAICHTDRVNEAQLRWFLVAASMRGTGLGPKLLDAALDYCRQHRLHDVHLWTFDRLHAAMRLYERAGFSETQRVTHRQWGQDLTEVRMDLRLRTQQALEPASI